MQRKIQNSVAIMQPYAFPYLGYFQLIAAVEHFVFYDNVNFIKRGWINRNKLLLNGENCRFTIPLTGASQNKKISEIKLHEQRAFEIKFKRTLAEGYARAPYLDDAMNYIEEVFESKPKTICDLAIASVILACRRIGIETSFYEASRLSLSCCGMSREDKLCAITKYFECENYVNSINGIELYQKAKFSTRGVNLHFLRPCLDSYEQQNTNHFVSSLSIIDAIANISFKGISEKVDRWTIN